MDFESVIRKRHSTRKFSSKGLEKEKLEKILEAGRIAPSAKNLQPIKIYVVKSAEGLEKIDKASPCRYKAPIVLIVCGNKDEAFRKDNDSTYSIDASITATHMMLEATNIGVDSVWVKLFSEEVIRQEFEIPENIAPICLLPIGYKDIDCPESSNHNIRKSIEEIVEYR